MDKKNSKSNLGFTLIEIMIVLSIIGVLMGIGLSRIKKKENNIKAVVREMRVLGREVRNHARLFNKTLRLVLEFKKEGGEYFIEESNHVGSVAVDAEYYEKKRKGEISDFEDEPKPEFQKYNKLIRKNKVLPRGLYFGQLETQSYKEPLTEGTGYIYFFPDGHLEVSAIQITDKKNLTWTVLFNPLTGEADIIEKAQNLRDVKR